VEVCADVSAVKTENTVNSSSDWRLLYLCMVEFATGRSMKETRLVTLDAKAMINQSIHESEEQSEDYMHEDE